VPDPRTLVLVRHGRTAWNLLGRAQGHTDIALDATGHDQAATLAPVIAAMRPSRLWSSDLARAHETASYLAEACGLPVKTDPGLREYDVGVRSGLTMSDFAERFPERYAAWLLEDESNLVEGEESTEQVRARVVPAMEGCLAELEPGETAVVVTHGACLMVGLMGLLGWPWKLARSLRGMENCGYAVVSEHPLKGGLRLTSYNEKAVSGRHEADFATDGPVG
jgi:glucosyl-3-phosphoglycerate phosphatase